MLYGGASKHLSCPVVLCAENKLDRNASPNPVGGFNANCEGEDIFSVSAFKQLGPFANPIVPLLLHDLFEVFLFGDKIGGSMSVAMQLRGKLEETRQKHHVQDSILKTTLH